MTSLPQATVRELLADLGWVRTLARALARDGHDADDLAQDACLAALQSPPPHDHNVRGWFQRVLANLVRQGERSRWRRHRREAALAGERAGAAAAPADELAER
ncbi:MAG: sigma factor, partial [Planctomycetota bacterium]